MLKSSAVSRLDQKRPPDSPRSSRDLAPYPSPKTTAFSRALPSPTPLASLSLASKGLPIATGVIEGACRHLIKDQMDITGARWGLESAEAILKLRSLRSSGDYETYWELPENSRVIIPLAIL